MSSRTPTRLHHRERALAALPPGVHPPVEVDLALDAPESRALADRVVEWAAARAAENRAREAQDLLAAEHHLTPKRVRDSKSWPDLPPASRDALVVANLEVTAASQVTKTASAQMHQALVELLGEPSTRAWLVAQFTEIADRYEAAADQIVAAEADLVRLRSAVLERVDVVGPAKASLLAISENESLRLPKDNRADAQRVARAIAEGANDE